MASNRLDLGNAFVGCADSLQWRLIETQAKIILHTGECNKYSYFFEDELSKPVKHPCMLGLKNWTISMVTNYLSEGSNNCGFYMPKIDYNVIKYWEDVNQAYPQHVQAVKSRLEKEWNFVKHLAQEVMNHSKECRRFKIENGKFGCLEILQENFSKWDERELKEFYEPKNDCMF